MTAPQDQTTPLLGSHGGKNMRPASITIVAASCLICLGCGSGAGKNLALDESDPPALFCEPEAGMTLRFSDADYAEGSGWLESYAVDVGGASGKPVAVKVKVKTPAAEGKRPAYVAEANGSAL